MTHYEKLESINPILPWAILVFALWLGAYVIRTRLPALWAPLTRWPDSKRPLSKIVQGLPTVIAGAAFAGVQLGDVEGAVLGAMAGALAPVWHHILKASPAPYRGAMSDAAKKLINARKSAGLLVLLAIGCGGDRPPKTAAEILTSDEVLCVAEQSASAAKRAASCKNDSCIDAVYQEAEEGKISCLEVY